MTRTWLGMVVVSAVVSAGAAHAQSRGGHPVGTRGAPVYSAPAPAPSSPPVAAQPSHNPNTLPGSAFVTGGYSVNGYGVTGSAYGYSGYPYKPGYAYGGYYGGYGVRSPYAYGSYYGGYAHRLATPVVVVGPPPVVYGDGSNCVLMDGRAGIESHGQCMLVPSAPSSTGCSCAVPPTSVTPPPDILLPPQSSLAPSMRNNATIGREQNKLVLYENGVRLGTMEVQGTPEESEAAELAQAQALTHLTLPEVPPNTMVSAAPVR